MHIGAKYGPHVDVNSLFADPTNLSRRYLPHMYETATESIKDILERQYKDVPPNLPAVGLTTDHWKDRFRKEDYTSMTAHFLDSNFKMQNYTLCVQKYSEESMHSERISDDLERKLSFYVSSTEREARQQREVMTCDSDIKMVRGVSAKFDRLACAAHDLNLAVKYGIQHSDKIVKEMDEAVQHLVDHCKRTSIGRELKNRLVTQCATRWNTHYLMYDSVVSNWDQLVHLLTERDELHYISRVSKSNLQAMANVLKPFLTATEAFSAEDVPTVHLVISAYQQLQSRLEKHLAKDLKDGVDSLRKQLLRGLEQKCVCKVTWWHVAACILDPFAKVRLSYYFHYRIFLLLRLLK